MCDVQRKPQDQRTDWPPELRQAAGGAVTSRPGRKSRRGRCTDLVVPNRSSTHRLERPNSCRLDGRLDNADRVRLGGPLAGVHPPVRSGVCRVVGVRVLGGDVAIRYRRSRLDDGCVTQMASRTKPALETGGGRPIACDMSALSSAERQRYDSLRPRVLQALDQVQEMPTAFRLRIGSSVAIADAAEWIEMEHRCCAFLDITLSLRGDGTTWVEIGGTAAIKAFLKEEFGAFRTAVPEGG